MPRRTSRTSSRRVRRSGFSRSPTFRPTRFTTFTFSIARAKARPTRASSAAFQNIRERKPAACPQGDSWRTSRRGNRPRRARPPERPPGRAPAGPTAPPPSITVAVMALVTTPGMRSAKIVMDTLGDLERRVRTMKRPARRLRASSEHSDEWESCVSCCPSPSMETRTGSSATSSVRGTGPHPGADPRSLSTAATGTTRTTCSWRSWAGPPRPGLPGPTRGRSRLRWAEL